MLKLTRHSTVWWAIETLTTVGYGDMVPATVTGKLLGGLVSTVGISTLALFSGAITVGFLDQIRIRREQAVAVRISVSEHALNGNRASEQVDADDHTALASSDLTCPHCGHILVPHASAYRVQRESNA